MNDDHTKAQNINQPVHNNDIETAIYDILHTAEHLFEDGALQEVMTHLEWAMKEYPRCSAISMFLGEAYLYSDEAHKSIRPLQWALELMHNKETPYHMNQEWEIHYLLGCALSRDGQYKKAMEHLEIANTLDPNNSEILRNLGWIMCHRKQMIAGRAVLFRAITLEPDNALTYNDLATTYMFEGSLTLAEMWVKKALEIDPNDIDVVETAQQLDNLVNLNKLFPKHRKIKRLKNMRTVERENLKPL